MNGAETSRIGRPLVRLGETASTSDIARLLASTGAPDGAVVVAARQTGGRGRLGRPWASPEGGLWCSAVLRPDAGAPSPALLSLAVGVAAAEAVERVGEVAAGLKWPNDVVIEGMKVAGILLEGAGGAVVAGIGVNVAVRASDLPSEVAGRAMSLDRAAGQPLGVEEMLVALLDRLGHWYRLWRLRPGAVVDAWRRRDGTRGNHVAVVVPGERLEGTAEGIDDDGALLLRTAGGVRRIVAGDLQSGGPTPGV